MDSTPPEVSIDRKGIFEGWAMENPCKKDCPRRSPTCHGKCEKYLDFSRERQAENVARYTYNQIMHDNEIRRRAVKCFIRANRK
jgi:hypothetical protein